MDKSISRNCFFFDSIIPSVQENFRRLGKPQTTKCILLLDNCNAHPHESELISECGNIYTCCFPPNVTSLIQPMDQGVMMNLKCNYKKSLRMNLMLKNVDPVEFQRYVSIKDSVYWLHEAWESVKSTTISRAWNSPEFMA